MSVCAGGEPMDAACVFVWPRRRAHARDESGATLRVTGSGGCAGSAEGEQWSVDDLSN